MIQILLLGRKDTIAIIAIVMVNGADETIWRRLGRIYQSRK
jgi:hypothetical protein